MTGNTTSTSFVGKYEASILSSKDWKKATGKDGKLFKHEMSQAHGAATESYRTRVSSLTNNSSIAAKLSQVCSMLCVILID
jgi:hypothetical protein